MPDNPYCQICKSQYNSPRYHKRICTQSKVEVSYPAAHSVDPGQMTKHIILHGQTGERIFSCLWCNFDHKNSQDMQLPTPSFAALNAECDSPPWFSFQPIASPDTICSQTNQIPDLIFPDDDQPVPPNPSLLLTLQTPPLSQARNDRLPAHLQKLTCSLSELAQSNRKRVATGLGPDP
ncbi:hypothetical protein PILCRDRAFT_91751 [Piloderma croceum F 1598]|uniref:Uncharacterized protein n=1 Tax=Piloderma croceum (strain F 1598) TaxID=765440 RepID=A0A0C3F8U5_PILCF|nr:hypothetical protein PILCRDRAFT_91751 [Piloderma croceum F 1598]